MRDIIFIVNNAGGMIEVQFPGLTPSVVGILHVESPLGDLYKNVGYDIDDFNSPDITTSQPSFSELPIIRESNGVPVSGLYTVRSKIAMESGIPGNILGDAVEEVSYFYISYPSMPLHGFIATVDCAKSIITVDDETDYSIETTVLSGDKFINKSLLPSVIVKNATVAPPAYTGVGVVEFENINDSFQVGAEIYLGTYNINCSVQLSYYVDMINASTPRIIFIDEIHADLDPRVACQNIMSYYYECINIIESRFEDVKGRNVGEAERLKSIRYEVDFYHMMYNAAISKGVDASKWAGLIKDILGSLIVPLPVLSEGKVIPTTPSAQPSSVFSIYHGVTTPLITLGSDGDFYFMSNGVIYKKVSGAWAVVLDSTNKHESIRTVMTDSFLASTDEIVHISGQNSAVTFTLHDAALYPTKTFTIQAINVDNPVIIATGAENTLNGFSTFQLFTSGDSVQIYSNGSNWFIK